MSCNKFSRDCAANSAETTHRVLDSQRFCNTDQLHLAIVADGVAQHDPRKESNARSCCRDKVWFLSLPAQVGHQCVFLGRMSETISQHTRSRNKTRASSRPTHGGAHRAPPRPGTSPSAPPEIRKASKDAANALADAQANNQPHRRHQAHSTRFLNTTGTSRAFALAKSPTNVLVSGDQRPPISPASTTRRALA